MCSPREEVANNLLETCYFGGLDGVKSKEVDERGKPYYLITFRQGLIKILKETNIVVTFDPSGRAQKSKAKGKETFRTEREAKMFIQRNFIA